MNPREIAEKGVSLHTRDEEGFCAWCVYMGVGPVRWPCYAYQSGRRWLQANGLWEQREAPPPPSGE